jgi:hypothetical protein
MSHDDRNRTLARCARRSDTRTYRTRVAANVLRQWAEQQQSLAALERMSERSRAVQPVRGHCAQLLSLMPDVKC